MPTTRSREKEPSPLEVATLLCTIIGAGMIAATYSNVLDLFQGYLGGIILLVLGATLFAYEKAPKETVRIYTSLLNFLKKVVTYLFRLVVSFLQK